jgi:hypothetical protein
MASATTCRYPVGLGLDVAPPRVVDGEPGESARLPHSGADGVDERGRVGVGKSGEGVLDHREIAGSRAPRRRATAAIDLTEADAEHIRPGASGPQRHPVPIGVEVHQALAHGLEQP